MSVFVLDVHGWPRRALGAWYDVRQGCGFVLILTREGIATATVPGRGTGVGVPGVRRARKAKSFAPDVRVRLHYRDQARATP